MRTLDISAPVPGAELSFTNVTATQITVNWGAATDDVTAAASLSYKVVRGPDAASIDTLAEADEISAAPGLVADYTTNLLTTTATELTSSTSYAFAVAVRDAAGNRALYTPAVRSSADANAPVVGTAMGHRHGRLHRTGQPPVQAGPATTAAAIDTTAEADAITGTDLLVDWTTNLLSSAVTGLSAGERGTPDEPCQS